MQAVPDRSGLSCPPRAPQPFRALWAYLGPCLAIPMALRPSCGLWRGLPVEGRTTALHPGSWQSTVPAPGVAAHRPASSPRFAEADSHSSPGTVFSVQPDPSPDCGHSDTPCPGQIHALIACHDRHPFAYLWRGMVSARAGCCVRAWAGHRSQKKPARWRALGLVQSRWAGTPPCQGEVPKQHFHWSLPRITPGVRLDL